MIGRTKRLSSLIGLIIALSLFWSRNRLDVEPDKKNDDKVPGKVLMNSGDVRYYIVHQGNYFIFRYLRH